MSELGKRLAELDKKATPVQWGVGAQWVYYSPVNDAMCNPLLNVLRDVAESQENVELIVALRNNLPAILAALAKEQYVDRLPGDMVSTCAMDIELGAAEILADWTKS